MKFIVSSYSRYNMDISNNQRNWFGIVERSCLLDGEDLAKPHKDGIMIMSYTDRIKALASQPFSQPLAISIINLHYTSEI